MINQTYATFSVLFTYATWFLIPFIFFNILVAALISVSVSLTYMRIQELKKVSSASGLTAVGIFFGMITGACPGCFVGLLPAIVGIFGGTFNLAILPWHGLELQLASTALLGFAIFYLAKDNTCKIKK